MTEHTEERPVSERPTSPTVAPDSEPAAAEPATPESAAVEMQDDAAPTAEAVETAASEVPADDELARDPEVDAALSAVVTPEVALKVGQRMKGKLIRVGETESFIDFGGRSEGVIATSELRAKPQEKPKSEEHAPAGEAAVEEEAAAPADAAQAPLLFKEGDTLQLVVRSAAEPITFTLGRKPMSPGMKKLREAFQSKVPVQGTVKKTNKGGFEVSLPGARAFCPFSQIDLSYCDNPETFVGNKYPFEIITFERNGRNIVVSRRRLLEEEAKQAAVDTRGRLNVGEVFEGTVRRLQPYGAFVDIGGVDGLVHVSQIRHGHVADPKEILEVGQSVKVKILKVEGLGTDRERISLSMKDLEPDPWDDIETRLPIGSSVPGKVVRLTEFGAFVELMPGVDGLIHISQISEDRIEHPKQVLQVEQEVQCRVLSIDTNTKRISLSLREASSETPRRPRPRRTNERERRRPTEEDLHYRSESKPAESDVDVSNMEYADALELLKQKFSRSD